MTQNSSQPKVFVLVLSYNGKRWLEECLPSVLSTDYPNYEVVVIDNGSSDGTSEYVKSNFPAIHVIRIYPNVGYSRGFNTGIRYAAARGAEYFLIMNNDTVIDRGALSALVETAQAYPKAGFVSGKIYFYDHPDTFQSVGKKEDPIVWNGDHIGGGEKDVGQYETSEERVFLDDIMTLVDRRLYAEVGGYDPQFFCQAEEFDWQVRAKQKGWKFYYTPKAKLWHRVSMSMGGAGNPIGRYFDVRSTMVVMARYRSISRFLRYYFHTLFQVTDSLLRGLAQLDGDKTKPRLAMWLGFWAGTLWLIHRQPVTAVPGVIRRLSRTK